MKEELYTQLLNRALTEELGLVVNTNNPKQLSEYINAAKRGISRYDPLIITVPSTPNTVIIAKRSVELDEDPNE